ncbi:MAG: ComF family protein [Actinomycetales bacterium]|nr:ComF family protein [Actinomycetales bacterium]
MHALREALAEFVELVLPVGCAGCGRPGVPLCPVCASAVRVPPRRVAATVLASRGGAPVWAGPDYAGCVARTVVAWKEAARRDLAAVLAGVLAEVVATALREGGPGSGGRRDDRPVLVVPVPSAGRAVRRRGEDVTRVLAALAVARLRRVGAATVPPLRVAPLLRQRAGVRDQAGLSAGARRANLAGGLRVARGARRLLPGRPVVVVDDIVTTGATLAAAEETLRASGADVVTLCALTATPCRRALAAPRSLD